MSRILVIDDEARDPHARGRDPRVGGPHGDRRRQRRARARAARRRGVRSRRQRHRHVRASPASSFSSSCASGTRRCPSCSSPVRAPTRRSARRSPAERPGSSRSPSHTPTCSRPSPTPSTARPASRDELRERLLAPTLASALANAIEARDSYLHGHCERLASLAVRIAELCDLAPDEIETVRLGAILHDIGKIGIPDRVLLKPAALDEEERAIIEAHPEIGDKLLEPLDLLAAARPIVRHHHERWDGDGLSRPARG